MTNSQATGLNPGFATRAGVLFLALPNTGITFLAGETIRSVPKGPTICPVAGNSPARAGDWGVSAKATLP
jgi:hypothetical protein